MSPRSSSSAPSWRIRRGPGCRGLRLPLRSGHHVNDTSTCSVVSRSRCCSAGRGVARARPCQRTRRPTSRWGARGRACHRRRRPTAACSLPPPGQPPSVPPVVTRTEPPRRLVRADSSGTSGTSSTTASRATCSTAACLRRRIPQCRRHRVIPCYCRRREPRRAKSHPANPDHPTNGFEGPVDRHATKPPCWASPRAAGTVIAKCSPEYDQIEYGGLPVWLLLCADRSMIGRSSSSMELLKLRVISRSADLR